MMGLCHTRHVGPFIDSAVLSEENFLGELGTAFGRF